MSGPLPSPNLASFTLPEVAAACGGTLFNRSAASQTLRTRGVSTDSRSVTPGQLFIALRGDKFDGHDYIQQAQEAGAVAAVVERGWIQQPRTQLAIPVVAVADTLLALGAIAAAHRCGFNIPVVAVTGSYGKTTVRALIAAALSAKFKVHASSGNFNNEVGLPQTLLQLGPEHGAAVLEMGMRGAGQITYLAKIAAPTVGVVTNIGPQHIELLGSVGNIAAAKAELLQALPPEGMAILPADDAYCEFLVKRSPAQTISFGAGERADYRVSDATIGDDGNVSFTVTHRVAGSERIALPLPGRHNAINAAAAIAVALELGVPLKDAARALEAASVPGARMRIVRASKWTIIDDCYNAGPNSMRAALETLRDFPVANGAGRRVAVLGSMKELGEHAEAEHRAIGAFAKGIANLVIGVGEETKPLLEAAFATHWFPDAEAAAKVIPSLLEPGDVVLVKGSRSVGLERVVGAIAA